MARKKPKARCFDPSFVYRTAVNTNLAETFARIRAEQAQREAERSQKVAPIKARKG